MNVSKVAKRGLLYTQTGTSYYASPEVWRDQPYDMKSDIWSLGCVLYESITLRPPFRADDMAGLYRKVLRGAYSRILITFQQTWQRSPNSWSRCKRSWDPHVMISWGCRPWSAWENASLWTTSMMTWMTLLWGTNYWAPSECQRICFTWQIAFPSLFTILTEFAIGVQKRRRSSGRRMMWAISNACPTSLVKARMPNKLQPTNSSNKRL